MMNDFKTGDRVQYICGPDDESDGCQTIRIYYGTIIRAYSGRVNFVVNGWPGEQVAYEGSTDRRVVRISEEEYCTAIALSMIAE
jgi:hypothetical protein